MSELSALERMAILERIGHGDGTVTLADALAAVAQVKEDGKPGGKAVVRVEINGVDLVFAFAGGTTAKLVGRAVDEPDDFPMQDGPPIPKWLAQVVYAGYRAHYPLVDQSLERIAERGGFGWDEVAVLWRDKKARAAMKKELG